MNLSKILISDGGFSLVEVLASFVIITIILLSFTQFFSQSNRVTASNNDKLIAVNLAEAELERMKIEPFEGILKKPAAKISINSVNLLKTLYSDANEERQYTVSIKASQTDTEFTNGIINILLTVQFRDSKSTVEGYVSYDKN